MVSDDYEDLVDAADIARRAGLSSYRTVHDWRRRYSDFPSAVIERGHCLLFRWSEVEPWLKKTRRLRRIGRR